LRQSQFGQFTARFATTGCALGTAETYRIGLAEEQDVSDASEVNQAGRKVTVAARVEPSLAEAVVALADLGNRSTSREIAAAIAEHVSKESASAAATSSSAVRSSAPSE
jgi:hypothetical protein